MSSVNLRDNRKAHKKLFRYGIRLWVLGSEALLALIRIKTKDRSKMRRLLLKQPQMALVFFLNENDTSLNFLQLGEI